MRGICFIDVYVCMCFFFLFFLLSVLRTFQISLCTVFLSFVVCCFFLRRVNCFYPCECVWNVRFSLSLAVQRCQPIVTKNEKKLTCRSDFFCVYRNVCVFVFCLVCLILNGIQKKLELMHKNVIYWLRVEK